LVKEPDHRHRCLLRARRERPRGRRTAEQCDEVALDVDQGLPSGPEPVPCYRMLMLSWKHHQVLGTDLNHSESRYLLWNSERARIWGVTGRKVRSEPTWSVYSLDSDPQWTCRIGTLVGQNGT
jgi:hypothetical protein